MKDETLLSGLYILTQHSRAYRHITKQNCCWNARSSSPSFSFFWPSTSGNKVRWRFASPDSALVIVHTGATPRRALTRQANESSSRDEERASRSAQIPNAPETHVKGAASFAASFRTDPAILFPVVVELLPHPGKLTWQLTGTWNRYPPRAWLVH